MKRRTQRLSLSKETLRALVDEQVLDIAGGSRRCPPTTSVIICCIPPPTFDCTAD